MTRSDNHFALWRGGAGSFASDLQIFIDGMSRAREGLLLLGFLMMLYLCVFGAILYMLEYDKQVRPKQKRRMLRLTNEMIPPKPQICPEMNDTMAAAACESSSTECCMRPRQGFTSIPTTWYFILATITTVGYGDHFPITIEGKIVTMLCMFCGILVLGLPLVVIGVSFDDAFKNAAVWKAEKVFCKPMTACRSTSCDAC
eukprot:SAG31_NODE_7449_length_1686_cov_1.666667_3_plen_200_part_00